MKPLRSWTVTRLLLVGAALFGLGVVLCVAFILLQATWNIDVGSGSGGLDAVSVGINPLMLSIPTITPVVLFALWLKARRSRT